MCIISNYDWRKYLPVPPPHPGSPEAKACVEVKVQLPHLTPADYISPPLYLSSPREELCVVYFYEKNPKIILRLQELSET